VEPSPPFSLGPILETIDTQNRSYLGSWIWDNHDQPPGARRRSRHPQRDPGL